MRKLLNGVLVVSMSEMFVERACMKVMREHVNDGVLDVSMSEIFVERVCMKVMRGYVNGHFKQYAVGHAGEFGEVRLWLRYRLCHRQAGWPVPILKRLYIVGCVSVCEVTEILLTVARNR